MTSLISHTTMMLILCNTAIPITEPPFITSPSLYNIQSLKIKGVVTFRPKGGGGGYFFTIGGHSAPLKRHRENPDKNICSDSEDEDTTEIYRQVVFANINDLS